MEREQQLLNTVKKLVAEERSVDVESGMCRFCGAIVEDHDARHIEGHKRSCPWAQLRRLIGIDEHAAPLAKARLRKRVQ